MSLGRRNDNGAGRVACKAASPGGHLGVAAQREVNPEVVLFPIGSAPDGGRGAIVNATDIAAGQIRDARNKIEFARVPPMHVQKELLAVQESMRLVQASAGKKLVVPQQWRNAL